MAGLENGTWVLVADGEKALFLENMTDAEDPNLQVVDKERHENPPDRDQGSDRSGRTQSIAGHNNSALQETDFHMLEKDRFANELSDMLYKLAHKGAYSKLVLVAAPHVLGVLRDHLHKEVRDKVVAEVPKTLTNHPINEIEQVLKVEMAAA